MFYKRYKVLENKSDSDIFIKIFRSKKDAIKQKSKNIWNS